MEHGPGQEHLVQRDALTRSQLMQALSALALTRDGAVQPAWPQFQTCPVFGVSTGRCARDPVCQGLLALTQRSPRSGRFTATRVQTREANWRRGLDQPPSQDRA